MDLDTIQKMGEGRFSGLLGLRFIEAAPECVKAEMTVRKEHCTVPDVLHGGAAMSIADTLGAIATFLNLPSGAGTTTLESKTNFLRAVPVSSKVIAECTPIHRGQEHDGLADAPHVRGRRADRHRHADADGVAAARPSPLAGWALSAEAFPRDRPATPN